MSGSDIVFLLPKRRQCLVMLSFCQLHQQQYPSLMTDVCQHPRISSPPHLVWQRPTGAILASREPRRSLPFGGVHQPVWTLLVQRSHLNTGLFTPDVDTNKQHRSGEQVFNDTSTTSSLACPAGTDTHAHKTSSVDTASLDYRRIGAVPLTHFCCFRGNARFPGRS